MQDQRRVLLRVVSFIILFGAGLVAIPMMGCGGGSSVNLSGDTPADTVTINNEESPTADENNVPVIEVLEDGSYFISCPDARTGDPDVDFVTVTCEGPLGSAVNEYSCAAGIVQSRTQGSDEDPEALFDEVRVQCGNNSGAGTIEEEELEVI